MRKDRVSLHKWPEDPNAAMNKSCEHLFGYFNPRTSHICNAHFTADSFEEQLMKEKSLS